MKRRLLITTPTLILIGVVATLVAMWSLARYQQARFESLSARVSGLRVGESTFDDAERIRNSYAPQDGLRSQPCAPDSCTLTISLRNFMISQNGLRRWLDRPVFRYMGIRPAYSRATVIVSSGRVREVHFRVQYETPSWYWLSAEWHEVERFRRGLKCETAVLGQHPNYALGDGSIGQGDISGDFVSATFLSRADEMEQRRCRYIKYSCITSPSPCGKHGHRGAVPLMPMISPDLLHDDAIRSAHPEQYSMALENCLYQKPNQDKP